MVDISRTSAGTSPLSAMRLDYLQKKAETDAVICGEFKQKLEFRIGDARDGDADAFCISCHNEVIASAFVCGTERKG